MPIKKSAEKAMRQNIRRRRRNIEKKDILKKTLKEYKRVIANDGAEKAKQMLSKVYKVLDKTSKTNVIHKNKANRLKSRLSQLITKSSKASS